MAAWEGPAYPSAADVAASEPLFDAAVAYVRGLPGRGDARLQPVAQEERLAYYGLFKAATVGPTPGKRPGMLNLEGQYKYDAWFVLQQLPAPTARAVYVDLCATTMLVHRVASSGHRAHQDEVIQQGGPPSAFAKKVLESDVSSQPRMWRLAREFAAAVEKASGGGGPPKDKPMLDALFWQAVVGDVFVQKPSLAARALGATGINVDGWHAWQALKGKTKDWAMREYIAKAAEL